MKNKIIYAVFLIFTSFLSACSHENPLEKSAFSVSGKFLYNASLYAEKKLNYGDMHGGADFGQCVEGVSKYSKNYCTELYNEIILFAKNQQNVFNKLTIEDLTDANAYFQVKSFYDNQIYIGK